MLKVFKELDQKYPRLKEKIRENQLKQNKEVMDLLNSQSNLCKEFRYKLPREEDLHTFLYQFNNQNLINESNFIKTYFYKRKSLACIRYIPNLVRFFIILQRVFNNRLTESDAQSLTVKDALETLKNLDSSEYKHLQELWDEVKEIWSNILEFNVMIDRQCQGQLVDELHIPTLDDNTLFIMLLQKKHDIDRPSIIVRLIENLVDVQNEMVTNRDKLGFNLFDSIHKDLLINSKYKTDISWLRCDSKLSISLMLGDLDPRKHKNNNYLSPFYYYFLSQIKIDDKFSRESIDLDIEDVMEYIIHTYTSNSTELISSLKEYDFDFKIQHSEEYTQINRMFNPVKTLSQKIKKLEGENFKFDIILEENYNPLQVINFLIKVIDLVEDKKLTYDYEISNIEILKELSPNNRKILSNLKVKHLKSFSSMMINILEEKKFMFTNQSYLPYVSPLPKEVVELFEEIENILSDKDPKFQIVKLEEIYTILTRRDLLKELAKYKLNTPLIEILRQKHYFDHDEYYIEFGLQHILVEHYTSYLRQIRKSLSLSLKNKYIKKSREKKFYTEKEISLLI